MSRGFNFAAIESSWNESELANRLSFSDAVHPGFRWRRDEDGVRADELRRSGSGANVWGTVEPVANRSRERRVCDRRGRRAGATGCGARTQRDYGGWGGACGHRETGNERTHERRATEM